MSRRDLIAGFCCWSAVFCASCGLVQLGYSAAGIALQAVLSLVLLVSRRYL